MRLRCPRCGRAIGFFTWLTFMRLKSSPCSHCRIWLSIDRPGRYWLVGSMFAAWVVSSLLVWLTGWGAFGLVVFCAGFVSGYVFSDRVGKLEVSPEDPKSRKQG